MAKHAAKLARTPNVGPVELAKALWQAERAREGSLAAIISGTSLGKRKAYCLLGIGRYFENTSTPDEQLAKVGWTKLDVIVRYAALGSEQAALDLALRSTARELRTALTTGRASTAKRHSVLLSLSAKQYALLYSVLLRYGAKPARNGRGLVGKERALLGLVRSAGTPQP